MEWLGILLALVTSVAWALGNVFTQRLGKVLGPPRAMLWSMATGGVLAAPCALLFDTRSSAFNGSVALWIAVSAVSGVVAYIALFFAFARENLTIAVPVVSSWPLVSGAVAIVVFGEALSGRRILGAVSIFAGVAVVSLARRAPRIGSTELSIASSSRWALPAALVSAVAFGVMVPGMGQISSATGAFGATCVVYALGIALALGLGGPMRVNLRPPPRAVWRLVVATGAVETIGFAAVVTARRFAPMTLVAPMASLSSTMTVLYAWTVLKERPTRLAIVGALLAGCGVVLLAR
jgi:drug/metabolite transporter (DMT)-like permease